MSLFQFSRVGRITLFRGPIRPTLASLFVLPFPIFPSLLCRLTANFYHILSSIVPHKDILNANRNSGTIYEPSSISSDMFCYFCITVQLWTVSATNIWGQTEIIRDLGEGIPSSARNIPKATILFSVLAFELGFILCHAMLFDILWSMLPFILLSISLLMSSTFSSRRLALFWISHKGHISLFSLKWHEIFSNVLMFDYAS